MLASIEYYLGRYASSQEHAQAGLPAAEAAQNILFAGHLHIVAALTSLSSGDLALCFHHTQQAFEIGEQKGIAFLTSSASFLFGELYRLIGADAQAQSFYQQAGLLGLNMPDMAGPFSRPGMLANWAGQFEDGSIWLDEMIVFSQAAGMGLLNLQARLAKAAVLVEGGQFDPAQLILQETQIETRESSLPALQVASLLLQAEVALQQGQPTQAAAQAQTAAERARAITDIDLEIQSCALLLKARMASRENHLASPLERLHSLFDCLKASLRDDPKLTDYEPYLTKKEKTWTDSR